MKNKQRIALLASGALLAGSAHAAQTAFWDFEGNVTDSVSSTVGTLNDGAATDGAAIAPSGSSSLSLDGSGATFTTGTAGGLGGTGSFTVFTFLQTTTTSDGVFFSYTPSFGVTGGADLRLQVQGNGDFRIEMSDGAGFNLSSGDFDLGDGSTHAVAAVFDASTGDSFRDVDLYVDGTLYDVTGGTDHDIDLDPNNTENNIIVGTNHLNARPYNGLVDNLSIYDTALTLTELDNLSVIPEPSSALLVGLGLLAIVTRRRR
jgi:hypothetical protein